MNTSCRKCGSELEPIKNCLVCDQSTQFECRKCQTQTEVQIHSLCAYDKPKMSIA
ncbi:MAG: hypothetical protein K5790_06870 [Nitrosopumilus sp.]|uniref:hypothetical protein n=1 Tax=Nitrosopumilus sp. TaxID=2024843 RepID=UPI00247D8BB8|nr:hypothetical protein [Nitrosopumilus sp.]MCV0392997.1 hypothetical protein [Nitrosopumilus sp.]